MATEARILIVDMGSQYTRVIERSLRDCGHRSAVLSPKKAGDWMRSHGADAIIISGSDKSVHENGAPQVPENIITADVPILGICYGMQWITTYFGGAVEHRRDQTGFGPTEVQLNSCALFDYVYAYQIVHASHGDSVAQLPKGAIAIATDGSGAGVKAMHIPDRNIWGVQFHPEVADTKCGEQILLNFVVGICGCKKDWVPDDLIETIRNDYSDEKMRVIHGFSGGVDSTVGAAILSPVLGDRLQCICIDAGHLRQDEPDEVRLHAEAAGVNLLMIEAEGRFFEALTGITDAEEKRKAFKRVYNAIFLEEAAKFGATHVVQGTLATDLIESGATGGAVIKSHHNVGLDWGDLQDLHPLRSLFKYEVRELASTLGLPESVISREPFPGPGLFLRMPGAVTRERRDRIRWADHEVRKIFYGDPTAPEVSQLVIALNDTLVVGVKGDARVYEEHYISPAILIDNAKEVGHHLFGHWALVGVSIGGAALGIIIAFYLYSFKPSAPAKIAKDIEPLYKASKNKWYVDELYDYIFVQPFSYLCNQAYRFDQNIIDGAVNGVAAALKDTALTLQTAQTGVIRSYATLMAIGAAVILIIIVLW